MMSWFPRHDFDEERQLVDRIAKSFRDKLTTQFGVTMVQDCAGEHGQAGKIYLTLRHTAPGVGDCHMTMEVTEIKRGMV